MLTYKTSLIPHCEVNGDQEMDLRDFKTYDVEALGYKCTVTGCRRSDREPGAGIAHSLDHGAGGGAAVFGDHGVPADDRGGARGGIEWRPGERA
jgi:hypothetical protein